MPSFSAASASTGARAKDLKQAAAIADEYWCKREGTCAGVGNEIRKELEVTRRVEKQDD